jgi:hypothetical protein
MRTHRWIFLIFVLIVAIARVDDWIGNRLAHLYSLRKHIITLWNHRKIIKARDEYIAVLEDELSKPAVGRMTSFQQRMDKVYIGFDSPVFQSVCGMFIKLFRSTEGAVNYSALIATEPGTNEPFEIIIQRKYGKSPLDIVTEQQSTIESQKQAIQLMIETGAITREDLDAYMQWVFKNGWHYIESEGFWEKNGYKSTSYGLLMQFKKLPKQE